MASAVAGPCSFRCRTKIACFPVLKPHSHTLSLFPVRLRWSVNAAEPAVRYIRCRAFVQLQLLDFVVVWVWAAGWKCTVTFPVFSPEQVMLGEAASLHPLLSSAFISILGRGLSPRTAGQRGQPPALRGSSSNPTAAAALLQKATGPVTRGPPVPPSCPPGRLGRVSSAPRTW